MEECGVERETEAEEGANCFVHKRDGPAGCSGSPRRAEPGPEACYGAEVWTGRRGHHVPMCCFLLQGMEINISMKSNSPVQTAAAPGDL